MFRKMGQGTSVDTSNSPGSFPTKKPWPPSASRALQLRFDVPLLLVVIVLLVIGLLMVYSASPDPSFKFFGNPFFIIQRQFLFMLIGVAIAGALMFFNYHIWQRLAVPMMAGTIIALIAVLVIGQVSQGAVRTLFGNSVQPSELAKLVIIIYLAVWLYAKRDQIQSVSFGLIPLAVMLGVLAGLIYVQPDLSAVMTVVFLGGLMFFLAGGDLKQIAILGMVALIVGWLVIQVSATGSARISSYMVGLNDPMQASDHVKRSIEAFINGGWIGVGIGKGQTKLTGLPVPHTDSIFAVVGEETGVLGALGLLILYTVLLWRGIKIARRAPDELGALLAAGLALWIAFEAFINMSVMVNLLPFAGNALPLISAGGSNMVVTLIAVGIILNISRLSVQTQENSGRFPGAVVDLRGRYRWRRVSRPDRSAGVEQKS
jgi:cell division protein FtsW